MNKIISFALLLSMLTSIVFLPSCQNNGSSTSSGDNLSSGENSDTSNADESSETSVDPVPDEKASLIWDNSYADENAGIAGPADIYNAKYYFDNALLSDFSKNPAEGDAKYILGGRDFSRFVNVADGYMITVPGGNATGDFTLSENRARIYSDDKVISISKEDQSPYPNTPEGWEIYFTEWLTMRIADLQFLSENNIMRTTATKTHTDLIEGYEVVEYDMFIRLSKNIEYPYYNIAVIRKDGEYKKFHLVVMKSKGKYIDEFRQMIASIKFFDGVGQSKNHIGQFELKIPEFWSDETKAYFNKLVNNNVPEWGFFYEGNKQEYIDWMKSEEGIDYQSEIFMTYLHIGWYSTLNYLDLDYVNANAGGNGFNGKPVLNLTYQFTTTNNVVSGYSPMFDIMRGKYDDHFRKLAQDIKAYGKPVIFRLNNEMNTDWTSYCGMVTLLDPDIFIITWRRLYDIFREEGVDNTIWVFNPIDVTCPFSDWAAYLTYFPGEGYVQMLGLTSYEMANTPYLTSFEARYKDCFEQYSPQFLNYPWMIGEFACGAGGEKQLDWGSMTYKDTVLGRNQALQAQWVEEMFKCFVNSTKPGYEFANKIKVAVWFSCNDYANVDNEWRITNYLKLDENLPKTLEKFRYWLPKIHEND
ncbi:MAG: glycoside hydrolase family 26 protein [Eubacteriales bacterium]|jgi:hypothetical protein